MSEHEDACAWCDGNHSDDFWNDCPVLWDLLTEQVAVDAEDTRRKEED